MSSKRTNQTKSDRFINKGGIADAQNSGTQPSIHERPRSLTMSPALIFANAIGEPDAVAITAAWKPSWRCILVDELPDSGWL
jgi:hypothetical protein